MHDYQILFGKCIAFENQHIFTLCVPGVYGIQLTEIRPEPVLLEISKGNLARNSSYAGYFMYRGSLWNVI